MIIVIVVFFPTCNSIRASTTSSISILHPQLPSSCGKRMRRLLVIYSDLYGGLLKWGTLKSSIAIGFSIINHPYFWGSPILGNFHIPHLLDQILPFVSLSCLSMRRKRSTTETLTAELCLHPIVLLLGIKRHEHTFTHSTLHHTQPCAHSNTLTHLPASSPALDLAGLKALQIECHFWNVRKYVR